MTVSWEEVPLFEIPVELIQVDPIQAVFDHWVSTLRSGGKGVKPALSDERKRKIKKALDLYGLNVCLAAITGCSKSQFHMGNNSRGKRYDDISLILRDAKHIEMFADMATEQSAEEAFLEDDE